jgi:hypothetical protein
LLRSAFHSAAAVASAERFPRRLAELLVFAASFRLLLRSGFVPYFLFPYLWLIFLWCGVELQSLPLFFFVFDIAEDCRDFRAIDC